MKHTNHRFCLGDPYKFLKCACVCIHIPFFYKCDVSHFMFVWAFVHNVYSHYIILAYLSFKPFVLFGVWLPQCSSKCICVYMCVCLWMCVFEKWCVEGGSTYSDTAYWSVWQSPHVFNMPQDCTITHIDSVSRRERERERERERNESRHKKKVTWKNKWRKGK